MVGEGAADDGDGSGSGNTSHVDSAEVNFKGKTIDVIIALRTSCPPLTSIIIVTHHIFVANLVVFSLKRSLFLGHSPFFSSRQPFFR